MRIRLYTGEHCELCEYAKELIYPFLSQGIELQEVDVTESLDTKKVYGLRIPVIVREADGLELAWPFDEGQLKTYLYPDP